MGQQTQGGLVISVASFDTLPQLRASANFICDADNDQVEIQAAINLLNAPGWDGGIVYLMPGDYYITSPIVLGNGVTLMGSGAGADGSGATHIYSSSATYAITTNGSGSVVDNLYIQTQGPDGGGINISGQQDGIVRNCYIYVLGELRPCVVLPSQRGVVVDNRLLSSGVGILSLDGATAWHRISRNYINAASGILCADNGQHFAITDNEILCTGNAGDSSNYPAEVGCGIVVSAFRHTVMNNRITGPFSHGIWVKGGIDVIVNNNRVATCGGDGILIEDTSTASVQVNVMRDITGDEIHITGSSDVLATNNDILGGALVQSTSTGTITAAGNRF